MAVPEPGDVSDVDLSAIGAVVGASNVGRTNDRVPLTEAVDFSSLDALSPEATPEQMESALLQVRESLPKGVDELTRETVRATIRQRYKSIPARMVNATVKPLPSPTIVSPPVGREAAKTQQGSGVLLVDDESWQTPVDGSILLGEVVRLIRRYVVLPKTAADAAALWVMAAFAIDAWTVMPMLAIVAPMKRSGKSTFAEVVRAVSPRGLLVASLTPAVLFRLVEKHRPTLIADEADTWLTDEKSDLRGIFNSGHSRSTAVVARCVGDDNEVRLFSTWAPKVIAMIGRLPATIQDRSIVVELKRKRPTEVVASLRREHLERDGSMLRRRLRRWADDHVAALGQADPLVPAGLHDRAADNWRPLLAVADQIGCDWPTLGREAAGFLSGAAEAEDINMDLLADIREIFAERDADTLASADLVAALVAMDGRPWAEWSQGRPMTPAKLASRLRPFGVIPIDVKVNGRVLKRYRRDGLADVWDRYVPATEPQPRNPSNVHAVESLEAKAQPERKGSAPQTATGSAFIGPGCEVAVTGADTSLPAKHDAPDKASQGECAIDGLF